MSAQNVIVYSFQKLEGLEIIIPAAFICDVDDHGRPGYIQANATMDIISSYGIDVENTIHKELLEICYDLNPVQLEKRINKNKKKPERLSVLFSDKSTWNLLQSIVDKKLLRLLECVKEHHCYICYQLQRNIKAYDFLLTFYDGTAIPQLQFTKTQTGVRYELKISVGEETVIPCKTNISILTNLPSTICIGNVIMPLASVNSAKIKPFLKQESVFVPEKLVRTYFSQFVTDVIGKVEITADGFEIVKYSKITKQKLFFLFDIFENKWFADIEFEYEIFTINASAPGKRKTKLHFGDDGEIVVYECTRDFKKEDQVFDLLHSVGLTQYHNKRFFSSENTYAIFEKINEHQEFIGHHFDLQLPEIDGKLIQFNRWEVFPDFKLIHDWFDLKGVIRIGDDEFPFFVFFKNIRNDDRFFRLKNGHFAIIPEEIMTKYSQIAKFASEAAGKWKLSKSHYMLLDGADMKAHTSKIMDTEDNDFVVSPALKASLRPYQVDGVKWIVRHRKNGLGACLADDMGLGKTLQTIAALLDAKDNKISDDADSGQVIQLDLFGELHSTGRKSLGALIVLPASLVFNWYKELRTFAPALQVVQYIGANRKKINKTLLTFDIVLTTYQTLVSDIEIFKTMQFHYIVLDESQQIRNKNSLTFQAVHQLTGDHRISLSGTPIENSLSDLWSQMEFINPSVLGSFSFFNKHFLIPIEKKKDKNALNELRKLVEPYILRRTKEQVAKDLPELIEVVHYTEMSEIQAKLYEKEKSAARNYLSGLDKESGQYRFHVLTSLMKLRQLANHPLLTDQQFGGDSGKYDDVRDQIQTVVRSGHKVLVFSSFVGHLNLYADWMENEKISFVKLTGSTASEDRKKAVETFQHNHEIQVFLLSVKAGGTGLNLTAADYVFILDPWWNPFAEKQAIARAHRIGRIQNVMVKRFISKNSIEEKILVLQSHKKAISDDVLEINDFPELNEDELLDLM